MDTLQRNLTNDGNWFKRHYRTNAKYHSLLDDEGDEGDDNNDDDDNGTNKVVRMKETALDTAKDEMIADKAIFYRQG